MNATAEVIITERKKKVLVMGGYKFGFHKELLCDTKRYKCSKRGCRAYLKVVDHATVIECNLEHNHPAAASASKKLEEAGDAGGPTPANVAPEEEGEEPASSTHAEIKVEVKEEQEEEKEEASSAQIQVKEEWISTDADGCVTSTTNPPTTAGTASPILDDTGVRREQQSSKIGNKRRRKSSSAGKNDDDAAESPEKRKYLKRFEKPINIVKRSKKFTDLQTKIKIIRQSEQGLRTSDISKTFDLSWTTVDSILKNKARYLEAANSVAGDVKLLKSRQDIFVQMEDHLMAWIYEEDANGEVINSTGIRKRAKEIFDQLKMLDPNCKAEFGASKGWFNRFLGRSGLKSLMKTYPGERYRGGEQLDWGRTPEIIEDTFYGSEPLQLTTIGYSHEEDGYDSDDSAKLVVELPVECVLRSQSDGPDNEEEDEEQEKREPQQQQQQQQQESVRTSNDLPKVKTELPDTSYKPTSPSIYRLLSSHRGEELTMNNLNMLFAYTREIKKILDRDPQKSRAQKAFSTIALACEPYRQELEALQARERNLVLEMLAKTQTFSYPISLMLTKRETGAQTLSTSVLTNNSGVPPNAVLFIKTENNQSAN